MPELAIVLTSNPLSVRLPLTAPLTSSIVRVALPAGAAVVQALTFSSVAVNVRLAARAGLANMRAKERTATLRPMDREKDMVPPAYRAAHRPRAY